MEVTIKPAVAYSWQEVGTWDETSRWVVLASERSGFVLPAPWEYWVSSCCPSGLHKILSSPSAPSDSSLL